MLFRFSLYGFLKNQRYFEPFLILIFLEKGLSFFWIGLLIGFREVCINVMEIPTGAIADLYGRRRCMVASFAAYIFSFAVFASSTEVWQLFAAMFLFACGDAFRTGTHKAMILDWLRRQGRANAKTKTYGYTRSWSKIGSAVSVVIAAALVFYRGRYSDVFWFSIPPCILNLINLGTYPKYLDGELNKATSMKVVLEHLWSVGRQMLRRVELRRVLIESMSFEGVYKSVKDYLQPVLKQLALALPVFIALPDKHRAAILVGAVYFALHMLSGVASRQAHRIEERWGGEEPTARRLWWAVFLVYGMLVPLLYFQGRTGTVETAAIVLAFVVLSVLQNVWRPVTVSRYDTHSDAEFSATILSVDSQAKSIFTMIAAPLLGLTVDLVSPTGVTGAAKNFWPVGLLGLLVAGSILVFRRTPQDSPGQDEERRL